MDEVWGQRTPEGADEAAATPAIDIAGWATDVNELATFLEEPNLCRLGTLDESGQVHVVPAWFHWDGERFYIGADAGDHKVRNILRTGHAAVEIDSDIRRKRGLLARGTAVIVDGAEGRASYERISIPQVRRYQPDRPPIETAARMASRGDPVVIEVLPATIISWGR
jgi:nitroimidazol reductase NimA-like FMN-containing flavoprotein (pyridoxamine 5'-phosphate oxidase superfamily)